MEARAQHRTALVAVVIAEALCHALDRLERASDRGDATGQAEAAKAARVTQRNLLEALASLRLAEQRSTDTL